MKQKDKMKTCQMTMGSYSIVAGRSLGSERCGRPAKFKVPNPQMNVEYVCGIHARSIDKMFQRTGQSIRCIPI